MSDKPQQGKLEEKAAPLSSSVKAAEDEPSTSLATQPPCMSAPLALGNVLHFENAQHKQQFEWLLMELLQAKKEIDTLTRENMLLRQENSKLNEVPPNNAHVPNDQFARQVLQAMKAMQVPMGTVEQLKSLQTAMGSQAQVDPNGQEQQALFVNKPLAVDVSALPTLETITSNLMQGGAKNSRPVETPLAAHINLVKPVTPAKLQELGAGYGPNPSRRVHGNIVKPEPKLPKVDSTKRSMSPPFQGNASKSAKIRLRKAKRGNLKIGKKSGRGLNLPRPAVKALKKWLYDNFDNPYPTEVEKRKLADVLGLDHVQVNTWFINARMRLWKPIVEKLFNGMKERLDKQVDRSDATEEYKADIRTMLEQLKKVQEAEDVRAKVAFMMIDPSSKKIMEDATAKLSSKNESESVEI